MKERSYEYGLMDGVNSLVEALECAMSIINKKSITTEELKSISTVLIKKIENS